MPLSFALSIMFAIVIGKFAAKDNQRSPEVNVNCPKGLDEKDYLDLRAKYLTLHNSYLDSSSKLEECNRRLKTAKTDLDYAYSRIEVLNDPPQAYCPPCDSCEAQEEE